MHVGSTECYGQCMPHYVTYLHIYDALGLLCCLLQNHSNRLMLSSEPRACTQIVSHHRGTLHLHLHTITVFDISLVADDTCSEIMTNHGSTLTLSSLWLVLLVAISMTLSRFKQEWLASGDKSPQQPRHLLIKTVPLLATLGSLTRMSNSSVSMTSRM